MNLKLIAAMGLCIICSQAYADTYSTSTTNDTSTQSMVSSSSQQQTPQLMQKNIQEGEVFLEKNKAKQGIVSLPDGLQYKIITAGKGNKPAATDTVVVDYAGRFIDGTEFDSSIKHGSPATFPVNAVIPGWTEVLQLMPVGSTWEVYIPSKLAYGDQGAPPIIEPGKTLIFKIKLLDIQKSA
jgi:FKBP-type peptidyl-prolyl cis-trans isomerase FkpA/FKBP-type peptidyl-prolyl cis-trans isomerase FklB